MRRNDSIIQEQSEMPQHRDHPKRSTGTNLATAPTISEYPRRSNDSIPSKRSISNSLGPNFRYLNYVSQPIATNKKINSLQNLTWSIESQKFEAYVPTKNELQDKEEGCGPQFPHCNIYNTNSLKRDP